MPKNFACAVGQESLVGHSSVSSTLTGKEMVDYIADYLTTVRTRRVFPNVKPGYMRPLIEEEAPTHGEPWENIFNDIDRVIMPGVSGVDWTEPTIFPSLSHRSPIGNRRTCTLTFRP